MNLEQGTQVIDLLGFARRRGKLAAVVAGVFLLVTYWVAMALPNLYSSAATILVEPQTVDEQLVSSGVRASDLNERLGLMTAEILSRTRLSKIIDDYKLYEDEWDEMERAEVVEHMRDFVSVEPVLNQLEAGQPRSNRELEYNTFRIVFLHEDREVARDVAQRIANDFIDRNIKDRTSITNKSLEFMRDKIGSLSKELADVEKMIADVKNESVGSLPDEMNANQTALQFATSDLRDAQRSYDSAQSDAAYWKNQALNSADLSTPNDVTSPGYRLRALDLERNSLIARGYTSKHPDMVRLEAEIAVLRQQMDSRSGADDEPASIGEQNARSEQRRAEQRAAAAAEDVARLRESIAGIEAKIAATPGVAERLDALNRNYDQLARTYQDFSDRLQQAGVQADMERRQLGEKFRILESAEIAFEPSSPNRILLLSLGAILGLALGIGIGLVSEVTDSSLHTTNELQAALGIPVLASVPQIMLESDRVARSRRIWRESLAAVGVVFVVLIGGAATYVFVNGFGSVGGPTSAVEEETGSGAPGGGAAGSPEARLPGDTRRG
jgi:polysaccharide biosynthesis transport protein